MLTLIGGIKRLQIHGQLSSNITSARELQRRFQFSPKNSMKSMLSTMMMVARNNIFINQACRF